MTPKVTQKPYAANQILVAKVTYDRFPGQCVYVADLKELHDVLNAAFVDDPEKFLTRPDYDFHDWMEPGEKVTIEMEFVSQDFLDRLEEFEIFG